ncbi:oxidoreductase domain protein [Beutenbergia cavernae DSM 12333]|uniref:Oxidoreductase domain protein n=1 Tax=Beutenbergia cavernae (strain ATCC BAA-8 / DSM 12333 / CCUG 43141 / JCM 11478 / NBRC 16432 / NCIMB 13614 / HKI 0122) TaxID=471853 RepID=C5C4B2_BEUC1|nr:Gfo/Idh/MocA family oxidoreductase [Beutenbergia cavernae]ACQ82036.1 oxidoreductase domain protein [Beutenbergia cavernae DSM 12333]
MSAGLSIAVVGLGFGGDFVPLYQAHPDVGRVGVVDLDPARLDRAGRVFGIEDRYTRYEDVLDDPTWDAVHVLAPVSFHAGYTVAALTAGKHVACAVPMATELDDIDEIVRVQVASGRRYMMMETSVYQWQFRATQRMLAAGELGDLTLYHGVHIQNLDGFPRYWQGYPPMQYLTHALSPALSLTGTTVRDVVAYGTGRLSPDRVGESGNPFPTEVGLFRLHGHDLVPEVTMSFFQVARPYIEGFSVYGTAAGVEWPLDEHLPPRRYDLLDVPAGHRGRPASTAEVAEERGADLLPASLSPFVAPHEIRPVDGSAPYRLGAGHGGSHPHLVHEFVSAVVADREPAIGTATSAAWTAPGICAHESALRDGERVTVPQYA